MHSLSDDGTKTIILPMIGTRIGILPMIGIGNMGIPNDRYEDREC